jgi:hypothetical protein
MPAPVDFATFAAGARQVLNKEPAPPDPAPTSDAPTGPIHLRFMYLELWLATGRDRFPNGLLMGCPTVFIRAERLQGANGGESSKFTALVETVPDMLADAVRKFLATGQTQSGAACFGDSDYPKYQITIGNQDRRPWLAISRFKDNARSGPVLLTAPVTRDDLIQLDATLRRFPGPAA